MEDEEYRLDIVVRRVAVTLVAALAVAGAPGAAAPQTRVDSAAEQDPAAQDPAGGPAPLVLEGTDTGAEVPPGERYRVEPVRTTQSPRIDGRLDEEAWLRAAVIDDFTQQEPSEGDPATERTVVRLMYDAAMLYVGVEAYDSDPDGMIATEKRRDSGASVPELVRSARDHGIVAADREPTRLC